jgi:hypothetical protein
MARAYSLAGSLALFSILNEYRRQFVETQGEPSPAFYESKEKPRLTSHPQNFGLPELPEKFRLPIPPQGKKVTTLPPLPERFRL